MQLVPFGFAPNPPVGAVRRYGVVKGFIKRGNWDILSDLIIIKVYAIERVVVVGIGHVPLSPYCFYFILLHPDNGPKYPFLTIH